MDNISSLDLVHAVVSQHVKAGNLCIDATAGNGNDTLFLCRCVGTEGHVIAFDIQSKAVENTQKLLKLNSMENIAEVYCESHSKMDEYAKADGVDCIMFNFGWMPGGDHLIFTKPDTSIVAITKGLKLLKNGGVMALCIYYGRETGYEEHDALLSFLKTIDSSLYTVIVSEFVNRHNCPPIPAFIFKH